MREIRFMPHQVEAMEKLRSGSILCGGVGTGKSITALGYYYIYICDGVVWGEMDEGVRLGPMKEPTDLYIITTARKRDTHEWEEECAKLDIFSEKVEVTIDSWNNIHKYSDVHNAFFIFDEQRVVGSGKWAKDFIRIARGGNSWILLSATPGDTWMDYIPVFVANGFYKNRTEFLRRHAVYSRFVTKYPKIERWIDTGLLERLRQRVVVKMTYEKRTRRHWEDIFVDYDREKYDRVWKDRWDIWEDTPIQDAGKMCLLLRRVVASSNTDLWGCTLNSRAAEVCRLMFEKHPKVIVFYNYDYELEALRAAFEAVNTVDEESGARLMFEVAEWNGHRHDPLPCGKCWAYLVQYTAGCEGWNCTETNCVIFFSQSYSYKQMEQAAGRIDRINTPFEDLYYYVLKSDSGIDRAIEKALKGKRNFNERLFAEKRGGF